ncbi:hypothetical protein DFH27DRAFT_144657 [Peziza echinospora]|nr:hypothetical protein DFH27DRAFT_144657 [Peziza echinospora]
MLWRTATAAMFLTRTHAGSDLPHLTPCGDGPTSPWTHSVITIYRCLKAPSFASFFQNLGFQQIFGFTSALLLFNTLSHGSPSNSAPLALFTAVPPHHIICFSVVPILSTQTSHTTSENIPTTRLFQRPASLHRNSSR